MAAAAEDNPYNEDRYMEIAQALRVYADNIDDRLANEQHENYYARLGLELARIGDELRANERNTVVTLLSDFVAASGLPGRGQSPLLLLIRQFVLLVSNKARISAATVTSVIRMFMQMWSDPSISNQVHEIIQKGTSESVPREMDRMDPEFISLYYKALNEGSLQVRDIKLMIVGMFDVGKTSLLRNIVDTEVLPELKHEDGSPKSTVGIDVIHCDVLPDGNSSKWVEVYDTNIHDKLSHVVKQYRTSDDTTDSGQGNVLGEHTGTSGGEQPAGMPDLADSEGTILYQRTPSTPVNELPDLDAFKDKVSTIDDASINTLIDSIKKLSTDSSLLTELYPRVAVWDFAGQNIYYSTHHFFLNARSIYLLLMDVSKPLDSLVEENDISGFIHKDFTCLDAFKFWLRSIYMYHSAQTSNSSVKPFIILVGTRKDKLGGDDTEKERKKDLFFDEALKSFKESPILELVRSRKFLVNNLDKSEDYASIRDEVLKTAEEQWYWNEKRPTKWIPLERSLEGLKAEGKEIISLDDLKLEDSRNEMPLKDESDLILFLRFQHLLGNLLFFEAEQLEPLKKYIILSPQWIIDAFRCFITHVPNKNPKQLALWDDYEKQGILADKLIDEIIDKETIFRDYKQQIVNYMELLDMIARPVDVEKEQEVDLDQQPSTSADQQPAGSTLFSNETSHRKEDFYIVPIQLPPRPDTKKLSELLAPSKAVFATPILAMVFKDGFLPPSIFHRLLAICIRKWPVPKKVGPKKEKEFLLYNGFAIFQITSITTLAIWYQDHIIYARVCSYGKGVDSQQVCLDARHFIANSLNMMPNKGSLLFEEYVQCKQINTFEPGEGLIRLRDFLYHDEILCDGCPEQHAISKNEGLEYWCSDLLQRQREQTSIDEDTLKKCITPVEMVRVALSCVGNEYERLGLELGLTKKRLEQIQQDYPHHSPTVIYQMLVAVKQSKERLREKLTVGTLRNAMIAVNDSDVITYDKLFTHCDDEDNDEDVLHGDTIPEDKTLSSLTTCIGHEYWLLGIVLGLDEKQLQDLRDNHRLSPTRSLQILQAWKNARNIDDKMTCTLLKAMKLVGCDYQKAINICNK